MKTKDQLVSIGLTEMKADEVMMLESKMLEQAVKFQYRKEGQFYSGREWHTP